MRKRHGRKTREKEKKGEEEKQKGEEDPQLYCYFATSQIYARRGQIKGRKKREKGRRFGEKIVERTSVCFTANSSSKAERGVVKPQHKPLVPSCYLVEFGGA